MGTPSSDSEDDREVSKEAIVEGDEIILWCWVCGEVDFGKTGKEEDRGDISSIDRVARILL